MAVIGKLIVSLSANTAKLVTELSKSRKRLKKWGADVVSIAKKAAAGFGIVASVLGGAVLVAVNRNAEAIDKLTKSAGKLNFNIEEYQKLSFIAAKSNIEMDGFGKSMQRMLKTVGDARAGLSTASDAFDQLGLSADQLAQLSPSEQFALIAERMSQIPTQADKVKVAMDIFGRGGADLLNVFAGDIKGIGDEFDSLGVTITQRQADMVAQFQDAKTSLNTLLSGFGRQFTAEVAPAFTLVIERITQSIKEMGGMRVAATRFAQFVIRGMIGAVEGLVGFIDGLDSVKLSMNTLQAVWLKTIAVLKLKPFADESFAEQLKSTNAEIDKLIDRRLEIEIDIANRNEITDKLKKLGLDLEAKLNIEVPNIKPNDLTKADGSRDYDGIVAMIDSANQAGTAQKQLAQSATSAADTLKKVSESKAWQDIFKADEITARSAQFDQYAKLAKANIDAGSAYAQSNINTLKSILETAKNNGGVGFSNNSLFEKLDLTGMAEVIKGLESIVAGKGNSPAQVATENVDKLINANSDTVNKLLTAQQNQPVLGKLEIDMTTDTGKVAGEIFGEPEFLSRLKGFVEAYNKDRAREFEN